MAEIKPLQAELKIIDNASKAFDAIKESILGASAALDGLIKGLSSYQELRLKPLELTAKIETVALSSAVNAASALQEAPPAPAPAPIAIPTPVAPITTEPLAIPTPPAHASEAAIAPIDSVATSAINSVVASLDVLQPKINGVVESVANLPNSFAEGFDAINAVGESSGSAFEKLGSAAKGALLSVAHAATPAAKAIKSGFSLAGNTLKTGLVVTGSQAWSALKRIGDVAKSAASIAVGAFSRLRNSLQSIKEKAAGAGLSLKSIGEAYWGVKGIVEGARAFSGIFKASDERARMLARLGNLSEKQRGAGFAAKADGSGYSVEEIDQYFLTKANELGVGKENFAAQSMTFLTGTGDAFGSIGEAARFNELLSKQFVSSGVSAEQAAGAIEQIRQGLSKGALQGEDLKSVLSSAPQIADLIAKKLNEPVGQLRELASQGKITTEVLKGAMFDNAEEIEGAFSRMPVTWESVVNRMKNSFLEASAPILQKIGEITSSDSFNEIINTILRLAGVIMGLVSSAMDFIAPLGPAISWILNAIETSIDLLGGVAAAIGAIIVAQKLMTATNPFLLIVTLILSAIVALRELWNTDMDFQYSVKSRWLMAKAGFEMFILKIQEMFYYVIGNISVGIAGLAMKIQDLVNSLIDKINLLKGSDIKHVSFADTAMAQGQKYLSESDSLAEQRKNIEKSMFLDLQYLEKEKQEAIKSLEAANAKSESAKTLAFGDYGTSPSKPLHTKGSTKIDKDSIQLLKDIASVELVNRYTTIRPKVRVNVGTINHEADADAFFERFAGEIENANATSLSEVYA